MPDVMPQFQTYEDHPGFYDHEADADLALPRRRAVADWGAGDLFHETPRRRRSAKSLAARERRVSGPIGPDAAAHRLEAAGREAVLRRLEQEAPATVTRIEEAPSYAAPVLDSPVEEPQARAAVAAEHGRRTVEITGRPEPRAIERRRPQKSAVDRIGHRPDHVAMWAFALGMLLIVLAVLSA